MIEVLLPYQKPITSVVAAPGSLPAGNYRISCYTSQGDYRDTIVRTSPFSDVIEVTLQASSGFQLSVDIPSEVDMPGYVQVVLSKDNEDWEHCYYDHPVSGAGIHVITITNLVSNRISVVKNYTEGNVFFGLNTERGQAVVRCNGSYQLSHINNAIANSSLLQGQDYIIMSNHGLVFTGSIHIETGELLLAGNFIFLLGGMEAYSVRAESLKTSFLLSPQRGGYRHSYKFHNCDIQHVVFNQGLNYEAGMGIRLVSGIASNVYVGARYFFIPDFLKKSTVKETGSLFYPPYNNLEINNSQIYIRSRDYPVITNIILYTNQVSFQIFWLPNADSVLYLRDCSFYLLGEKLKVEEIRYLDFGDYGHQATIRHQVSFSINVFNSDNQPLNGVEITFTSEQGIYVYNTDNKGQATGYITIYDHSNDPANPNQIGNDIGFNVDYNPYAITLQKPGYNTIIYRNFIIQEKINWSVVMEEPSYISETLQFTLNEPEELVMNIEETEEIQMTYED